MLFSFIYLIFLLKMTRFYITLTSIYAVHINIFAFVSKQFAFW